MKLDAFPKSQLRLSGPLLKGMGDGDSASTAGSRECKRRGKEMVACRWTPFARASVQANDRKHCGSHTHGS